MGINIGFLTALLGNTPVVPGTAAASSPVVLDSSKGVATITSATITTLTTSAVAGNFRSTGTVLPTAQAAAGTLNATGTLTATLLLGGIVTSTTAAGVTATLDTGTLLDTAYLALFPAGAANDYFEFSVVNTGGNSFTIATAGGWTDGGNFFTAVPTATSSKFGCRRTAANTWTGFKVG